jgi:hypothetical protein
MVTPKSIVINAMETDTIVDLFWVPIPTNINNTPMIVAAIIAVIYIE